MLIIHVFADCEIMDFIRSSESNEMPRNLSFSAASLVSTQSEDTMPSPTPVASPASKSPTQEEVQNFVRQNHVSNVMLSGVNIVSLVIDGSERLCLAQISNTLLKEFSYNEIHNRRVALGITCVQCTPVQLEILRRAGAMPISSRRCGMITKREAERLVKSFLEDTSPPKLPENFAFNVKHQCGWGCNGSFVPSRYNSSRAKCIKCTYCNVFFSPNKFIFHFHRTPESKYKHPDAANFNSWRRHIFLDYDQVNQDIVHCWEDVKAMFNGGSRKRLCSTSAGITKSHNAGNDMVMPKRSPMDFPHTSAMSKFPRLSYPYPVIPPAMSGNSVPSNCPSGFIPRVPHPAFPFSSPTVGEQSSFQQEPTKLAPNFADFWKNKGTNPYYNPFGLLWAKNLGFYGEAAAMQYGNAIDMSRQDVPKFNTSEDVHKYVNADMFKMTSSCFPQSLDTKMKLTDTETVHKNEVDKYMSAFRPVNKDGPFTVGDYKQLRLSAGSDEIDNNLLSPATQSESDTSGMDLIDEAGCQELDEADINVTDVEHHEATQKTATVLEEDVEKEEKEDEKDAKKQVQLSTEQNNNAFVSTIFNIIVTIKV